MSLIPDLPAENEFLFRYEPDFTARKRLRNLIRLAKENHTDTVYFSRYLDDITIRMQIEGKIRRLKSRNTDLPLMKYILHLADLEDLCCYVPKITDHHLAMAEGSVCYKLVGLNTITDSNIILKICEGGK